MILTDLVDRVKELLYEGITDNNWECISEAYQIMAGEKVDVPESEPVDELSVNLKNMLERLEKLEKKEPPKKKRGRGRPRTKKPDPKVDENFSIKSPKSKRAVKSSGQNKFESMAGVLEEAEQEKGFNSIDDSKSPRTERKRREYQTKNVTCSQCNKSFDVNPMFARENYICDKCVSRRT